MKKTYCFFCILVCTELFANLPRQKLDLFVVGTTGGYAPYVSLNEKGDYEDFDIDVANCLSKKLGRDLVLKDLGSMPGFMIALKQGKIGKRLI